MKYITVYKSSACGPTTSFGWTPIYMPAVKAHPTPGCLMLQLMLDRIEANERAKKLYKTMTNMQLGTPYLDDVLRPVLKLKK